MLDTNCFNRLLDGHLLIEQLPAGKYAATHVQKDELSETSNIERRQKLEACFSEVVTECVPTSSFVWDVSRWDLANWPSDASNFQAMLKRLAELDDISGKKVRNPLVNQTRDILIAETAIATCWVLVSSDINLAKVCEEFGGSVRLIS